MKDILKTVKIFILDLIFPGECLGCGREGSYLCGDCLEKIDLNHSDNCALCHKPSSGGKICAQCQPETKLKAIWVAADYNQKVLQDLIHNLKYNYLEAIGADLSRLLVKYLKVKNILEQYQIRSDNAVLIPVPLHKKRFLNRGFNQSDLLAAKLSADLGIGKVNFLTRIKNTQTQINLNRSQRQQNIKDAFSLKGDFNPNKKAILIDDVVTTGSTLKECAKVLADSGFTEIYGLVIAQREE